MPRRCIAPRSSFSARCHICIWRAMSSPTRACHSKRSTRCRWPPSRMPARSISCSTRSAATSRGRRSWRCSDRRTFSCRPVTGSRPRASRPRFRAGRRALSRRARAARGAGAALVGDRRTATRATSVAEDSSAGGRCRPRRLARAGADAGERPSRSADRDARRLAAHVRSPRRRRTTRRARRSSRPRGGSRRARTLGGSVRAYTMPARRPTSR